MAMSVLADAAGFDKVKRGGGPLVDVGIADDRSCRIWIIGAGTVGCLALERLGRRFGRDRCLVVDRNRKRLNSLAAGGVAVYHGDGVAYLSAHLTSEAAVKWIVPAVPFHLAARWVWESLRGRLQVKPISVPEEIFRRLPNAFSTEDGGAVSSNAAFLCPDDCPEPSRTCTRTGEPHPRAMFDYLTRLAPQGWRSVVIRSIQLAPGIGGISPQALFDALERIAGSRGCCLVGTACRCHGILHAFDIGAESDACVQANDAADSGPAD
jgi:hypothetical protein